MYRLNQIKLNISHNEKEFRKKIAKIANVSVADIDWATLVILHKAIDARDKKNILFVYNVAFDFVVGALHRELVKKLERYEPIIFNPIVDSNKSENVNEYVGAKLSSPHLVVNKNEGEVIIRPIVVGFGPAGIFASYILALNGVRPIIFERGKSLEERTKDVEKFFDTLELDENSNVCFGEGGAGAFSDGKLNTNNKDKTGIYKFVLETFVKFGADEKILYENLPHIGTDKLIDVIKNMRNEIVRLGGVIYYNTKLTFKDGLASFAPTGECSQSFVPTDESFVPTITKDTPIILAIGNSSRDTFRELIENGFDVKAKAIAVGYRIAHRQSFIDESQYGVQSNKGSQSFAPTRDEFAPTREGLAKLDNMGDANIDKRSIEKLLGPATYKLTYDVGNGHSVYSFCMCPGGYIINSSNFNGMLSINGMSYNDRNGKYANSAIVETISPNDVAHIVRDDERSQCVAPTDKGNNGRMISTPTKEGSRSFAPTKECSPLQMIEFQERVEKAAFEIAKGFIPYVTSKGSDICNEEVFKGKAKYCEKLKLVYEECGLAVDINKDIDGALKYFNKLIPGFYNSGSQSFAPTKEGSQSFAPTDTDVTPTDDLQYIIAGVETRTSSPVKLDRDENYMCNVHNFYPCGEGLGHGGGIMSCAVDGINVAISIVKKLYSDI